MWSGNEQYSQWALNPSAYQNVAHDKVDWAALAQQWIQMKDTLPEDQVPPAPPPPPLRKTEDKKKDGDVEGGEAPMEVEKDDLENVSTEEAPTWGAWNNWQQWGGWGWNASGVDSTGGVPPPTPAAIIAKQGGMVGSALPVPGYGYPSGQGYTAPSSGNFDYNQAPVTEPYNQVMVGGYWTAGPSDDVTSNNLPGSGPVPFIRNSRQDWRRSSRGHERTRTADKSDEEEDSTIALDAAKRRQLPAWIREGLEKMEREKQKKIDRDRQIKEREIYLQKKREEEEEALNDMEQRNSGQPMVPKKSKFESDSEESDHGDNQAPSPISTSRRKSRFRNADSPASSPLGALIQDPTPEPEPIKTREEILHEKMLYVRRLLTEILLEVTTEEMESVAQEVLSKAKAKAPALQLRKTPALASLTGKLGLGMYGDSDESNSDDESSDGGHMRQVNGADSDEELKDQIQRRKQEFSKTEREIEARLMEEEEKERDRERRLVAEVSDDDTGEERQVEKQSDSKRPSAHDGIKIKEEHDKTSRSANHLESMNKEENSRYSNNDHCSPPHVKKEKKSEDISDHSSDLKTKHRVETSRHQVKAKVEKSVTSDENEETSSKSDSDSSSSSKSMSSSSVESRRSTKKSSKGSQEKKSSKKSSDNFDRICKKSDKRSIKSKDKKRDYGSKELKAKDKKKEKHRKPRSRSKSGRSRSKESRRTKRSRSRESRRSRRSRSRESYRSKTGRRESQSITSRDGERRYSDGKHGLHKSHSSHSKSKNHDSRSKEKNTFKYRDSRSPVKEKKSSSSLKRRRDSSLSRSPSRSKSHRYANMKDSLELYSRSRSSSVPPRSRKKSQRHRSSSSSETSSYRAKGKTAGR